LVRRDTDRSHGLLTQRSIDMTEKSGGSIVIDKVVGRWFIRFACLSILICVLIPLHILHDSEETVDIW
jgi:hypothetical protein